MSDVKETKSEKFKRLAVARVNACLHQMKLIKNLANRNNYEWTDEEVKKIVDALQRSVNDINQAFKKGSIGNERFKL